MSAKKSQTLPTKNADLLMALQVDELSASSDLTMYKPQISNVRDVASYNWLNKRNPTMLVPGKPPAWTPLKRPLMLKQDEGDYFRDPNAARFPSHPMEPAVQAIMDGKPESIEESLDIFACGSTLGNLLRFVRGDSKPFRIRVETVGDTVFFIRHENSPTELIPNIVGYGHTFPEAYTTWDKDIKGSESHQRIIQYELFGLQCLFRFEADGYREDKVTEKSKQPQRKEEVNLEALMSNLKDSSVSAKLYSTAKDLKVVQGGHPVPQSTVLDIKTRSIKKMATDTLAEELPRLWMRQISNFVLAYHTRGLFNDIRVLDVRSDVQKWQKENEPSLRLLGVLLRTIINLARGRSDGKLELRYNSWGILEVRKPGSDFGDVLSAPTMKRWLSLAFKPEHSKECIPVDYNNDNYDTHQYASVSDSYDEGSDKDYTACSAEDCGYCGHCGY